MVGNERGHFSAAMTLSLLDEEGAGTEPLPSRCDGTRRCAPLTHERTGSARLNDWRLHLLRNAGEQNEEPGEPRSLGLRAPALVNAVLESTPAAPSRGD